MVTLTMIKTAFRALWRYVVWRKCKKVEPKIRDKRMHRCYECAELKWIDVPWFSFRLKCSVCGCFVRLKVWCIDEKCPVGKW